MMGDHNRPLRIVFCQLAAQPCDRVLVDTSNILSAKSAIFVAIAYETKIIYQGIRFLHGRERVAARQKIRPQNAA